MAAAAPRALGLAVGYELPVYVCCCSDRPKPARIRPTFLPRHLPNRCAAGVASLRPLCSHRAHSPIELPPNCKAGRAGSRQREGAAQKGASSWCAAWLRFGRSMHARRKASLRKLRSQRVCQLCLPAGFPVLPLQGGAGLNYVLMKDASSDRAWLSSGNASRAVLS